MQAIWARIFGPHSSFWVSVNSFLIFVSVAIGLIYAHFLSLALGYAILGRKCLLFFGVLENHTAYDQWSPASVALVYMMPVLFALGCSVASWWLYGRLRRTPGYLRVYVLWIHVLSVVLLLSSFVLGLFLYQGLAVPLNWYGVDRKVSRAFGGLFLLLTALAGLLFRQWWLKTAPSASWKVERSPKKYLLQVALLPAWAGCLAILPVAWRVQAQGLMVMLGCVCMLTLTAVAGTFAKNEPLVLVKDNSLAQFSWLNLTMFGLAIAFMLYTAGHGLSFNR
ncbi:MAG: hypothetical protein MUC97_14970 [Bernardetiaceae bacterium]|jgi:hypothetical protein|nr:hypothetical protein [Bernardetiaceae bacterium]